MHILEFLHSFLLTPHIEIVKPALPEVKLTGMSWFLQPRQESHLSRLPGCPTVAAARVGDSFCFSQSPKNLPRNLLLEHLHDRGGISDFRFTYKQMKVLRHDHVANQSKSVVFPNLAQGLNKQGTMQRIPERWLAKKATAGDEVQVIEIVVAVEPGWHAGILTPNVEQEKNFPTLASQGWGTR